ncbi:tumor necrosis factor receptor superfamily member 1A isoform X2 [Kryptolebias marmoratus]|uniref:tumor necrosis factor receptor superfamily member 1A isoform X2 n=1 Tax=Kryptolebias marmoratus TaxID=37003 RepID=UPI000D52FC8B|nr:tumor necrosis factor receptor superfamily member 1A isoform X2 [Kryptolebias marmoratus]
MEFAWVAFSVLALVFSGQSRTSADEQTSDSCHDKCPAGYFLNLNSATNCTDSVKKHPCKECPHNHYTAIPNTIKECLKCSNCGRNEVEVQPCTSASDRKCGCKDGFSLTGSLCLPPSNPLTLPEKTPTTPRVNVKHRLSPNAPASAAPVSVTTKRTSSPPDSPTLIKTSNKTSNPAMTPVPDNSNNHTIWLFSVVTISIFLVLFCFLVFSGSVLRKKDGCFCWSATKNLELPAQEATSDEHCSHHGSSPTTLTFTISEKAPMMLSCQEPPAHISGQMPDSVHTARQDKQSSCWPAIVLYAIIKEVPLRRWKEFLRLLSVTDQQMERVELEASLGSMEKQYQMLRLWSLGSSASLSDVYSALHHMDLSGCAQLLQESLEKLQRQQGPTA